MISKKTLDERLSNLESRTNRLESQVKYEMALHDVLDADVALLMVKVEDLEEKTPPSEK